MGSLAADRILATDRTEDSPAEAKSNLVGIDCMGQTWFGWHSQRIDE